MTVRAADFHYSGPSGLEGEPPPYTWNITVDIRKKASPATGHEMRVNITPTGGATLWDWDARFGDGASGSLRAGEPDLGEWFDVTRPATAAVPVLIYANDDLVSELLWPADGYNLLVFTLTNTTDVWREAGIFATEAPGTMWFRRRVAPQATVELVLTFHAADTWHYYAAFVDVAATMANNPTSVTVQGEDGKEVAVYSGVVPDTGSASDEQTAAQGEPVTLGSASNLVSVGVPPSRVPSRNIPSGTGAATNDHLTAVAEGLATVVEGGDKAVEAAVRELGAQSNQHASAIEGLLGSLRGDVQAGNELLTEINDRAQTEKERVDQALEANPTVGEMGSAGADASAQIRAVYGTRPTGKGYALDASGAPNLTVAMPAAFGGQTFDLNPFQAGRFQTLCTWFRAATAWLVIGLLGSWAWSQVGEWTRGFSTLAQARGNAVVAGTGAQGTALVAAGLITVAIVTGTTTLLSWAFDDINFASFVAVATTNPVATIPTGILWMLDQVLPVATIITAFVARITFNIYASTLFAGAAAVVRFIVP